MDENEKEFLAKATVTYDITKPNLGYCSIDYGDIVANWTDGQRIMDNWKEELRTIFDNLNVSVVDVQKYEDYADNARYILLDAANELTNLTSEFLKSVDRSINYDFEAPANISTIIKEIKLYPRIELELYKNSDTPESEIDNVRLEYKGYIGKIRGFDDGKYIGRIFPPSGTDYIEFEVDSFNDIWKEFTDSVDYYITTRKMYDKLTSDMKATVEVDDGDE